MRTAALPAARSELWIRGLGWSRRTQEFGRGVGVGVRVGVGARAPAGVLHPHPCPLVRRVGGAVFSVSPLRGGHL